MQTLQTSDPKETLARYGFTPKMADLSGQGKGMIAKEIETPKPYFLTLYSHSTAFLFITPYEVKKSPARPRRRYFSNTRKYIVL
jgi:hypothetical protein